MASAVERLSIWTAALFEELLPLQDKPDVPVLLACDDETVRAVSARLVFPFPDPAVQFASDTKIVFAIGNLNGFKNVITRDWERAPVPRALPPFFPVLCLWVLAASRMAADGGFPTSEYHGRLCQLLDLPGDDALPSFEFIGARFRDLAGWLERDLHGERGRLIVPDDTHPKHVGYAIEQTVFRARDRHVLSRFFTERLGTSLDGIDPLQRLRRWPGQTALTQHAQRLVQGDEFAERVRAGIHSAFHTWDRSELVDVGGRDGRVFPAVIRLVFDPLPKLQMGSRSEHTLDLAIAGEAITLHPRREVALPWTLLEQARVKAVDLGDSRSAAGALRIPRLGATVLFEQGESGLLRTDKPAVDTVWVLSRDGSLQEELRNRRFTVGENLPDSWQLFYEVPIMDMPGIEPAARLPVTTPLRIDGGLPLGHRRYLSDFAPRLYAGDLDTVEELPVVVNGELYGSIRSDGELELPAKTGSYEIVVGAGEFRTEYDVASRGDPLSVALCHRPDHERALRSGARPPLDGREEVAVCGATISIPYGGPLPFLTRVTSDAETINTIGELHFHRRPPTQVWFREVGLDERGRWEIFDPGAIWLLLPGPRGRPARARLLTDLEPQTIGLGAAKRVLEMGERTIVVGSRGVAGARARERWLELLLYASLVVESSP